MIIDRIDRAERCGLALELERKRSLIAATGAVIGMDGFIDVMISVVGARHGIDNWTPLPSMAELGRIVSAASGHNSLREIVIRGEEPGGCAVNMGDGLHSLGVGLDFLGTLGSPRHPSFAAFAASCRSCTNLGTTYGRTLAFEFGDGKFMFSAVNQLAEIDVLTLAHALADGHFLAACRSAPLIALTNWALYPHMTACWQMLGREVFARLEHRPWLYLDLVDPSSRSDGDIKLMLDTVTRFEENCQTVLGLNLNEANVLGRLFAHREIPAEPEAIGMLASTLQHRLAISQVVIHHPHRNAAAEAQTCTVVPAGPFCATPRKTTGAGDRFNAGYCLGLLLDLPAHHRLLIGSVTSGLFVRTGRSPTLDEVIAYLTD